MRAPRTLAITLIVLALTAACVIGRTTADLAGYRPTQPNSDRLTVLYVEGSSDGPGHVEVLRQDTSQVQVRVTYKRSDKTSNLIAVVREAVATLKKPLGSRKVVDQDGNQLAVKRPEDYPRVGE
jgi:hypothetical protein